MSSPPFMARNRNLRGIAWLMLSLPQFQLMNAMLRYCAVDLPPVEVMFFRNLFGFIILFPVLLRNPEAFRTRQIGMHAIRGLTHLGGMVTWVYALTMIPFATAAALFFSTPLFVAIGAVVVFREHAGLHRWIGLAAGFAGVLIITPPGMEAIALGSLFALLAAILHGSSKMMVKVIVRTDSTMATVFHLNLMMALFGLIPTIIFWETPTLEHFGWFILLAIAGAGAHYSLTRSIEYADLTALQPLEFVQLGWAVLLGFVIFSEIPEQHVLLGGAVIIAATSYMMHAEAKQARRAAQATPE